MSRMLARTLVPVALLLSGAACSNLPTPVLAPDAAEATTSPSTATMAVSPGDPSGDFSDPGATADSGDDAPWGIVADDGYARVVDQVVGMTGDPSLQGAVGERGLGLMNVMWEDTGRSIGSSVGPNITDLTLQVRYQRPGDPQSSTALMPVIRFPNFSDRTGDVPADRFFVRVGNQRQGGRLESVPLTDVLRNVRRFVSDPESIGGNGNLLAARDSHFLVSAQAVFLPIPKAGKAEFNPVVFNYQSSPESPAVLTMLVTRQGTSIKVIDNVAEDQSIAGMGQELYHNAGGKRAALTAERKSTVEQRIQSQGGPKTADDRSSLQEGADVLFLVQVPLKHRAPRFAQPMMAEDAMEAAAGAPAPMAPSMRRAGGSDVEQAVLGHGRARGPYVEGSGLRLERDPRFPIRITVQFYKATSNGVVDDRDLDSIAKTIGNVYEHADFVGSLVLPPGDSLRPTAWNQPQPRWFAW
ncbi:MAG: hypothetical protein R3B72_03555 [Polyangiaceae bacterium]